MLRRLLVIAFLALAVLGLRSPEYAAGAVAEAHEDDGCCPCEEDGAADDGCCASAQCACFSATAIAMPERLGDAPRERARPASSGWVLGGEQRARDRSSAPPIRPPIG